MSPQTPPRSRADSRAEDARLFPRDESSSESELDSDADSDMSDYEHDSPAVVCSPTNLTYLISHLPESTQNAVRSAFREPPKISLEKCRRIDNTYAFQMTELVTRSVRIRASSDGASELTCSCGHHEKPCEHLLWLLDQVVKQTVYEQDVEKPLNMTNAGFPVEMGDPFQNISKHHLDILAEGIHCQVITPDSEYDDELDSYRVQEARELLSSIYDNPPEDYRPDIFTFPSTGKKILKRNDLDYTIFRMLLDNHHFFHYFLSLSRSTDPIRDPFRKYSQRVDHVLNLLDAYSSSAESSSSYSSQETPPDVIWTSDHILGTIGCIKNDLYHRERPLSLSQATSAARCLVHTLEEVVARNRDVHSSSSRLDRNLYLRLIGDRDQSFILDVLGLLPEAARQFLNNLESILEQLGVHGAPATYVEKFHKLLRRLRASRTGSGLKRSVQGGSGGRETKRMK